MVALEALGGLAGLASGVLGSIGGHKAAKEQKKNWQAALQLYQGLKPEAGRAFAGEMAQFGKAEGRLNTGFDMARKAAAGAGQSGVQDIMEGRQTTLASLKQHLLDTGGFSSALYSNAVRGTSAQATRQLAQVRQMVASMVGDVEAARGGALAEIEAQKAGAWGRNYGRLADLATGEAGLRSQYQPYAQSGAGGWGQFLGMLAPLLQKKGGAQTALPAQGNYSGQV